MCQAQPPAAGADTTLAGNVMQRHNSHASAEAKRRVVADMESLLVGNQWEGGGAEGQKIAEDCWGK
jgi:hypothetical protein